jgi:hypothetical protein
MSNEVACNSIRSGVRVPCYPAHVGKNRIVVPGKALACSEAGPVVAMQLLSIVSITVDRI